MGVITLALIANGTLGAGATTPLWVIVSCALTIAAGTYSGGWRVIRTLGKGLVEIDPPQGFAAESSSAAVILLSTHFGYSLSTTQVATGSILGCGAGKKGAPVRWNVARRMGVAWVLTLPSAPRSAMASTSSSSAAISALENSLFTTPPCDVTAAL